MVKAQQYLQSASDAGDVLATQNLGILFLEKGEVAEAVRVFRLAAGKGNASAMENLAAISLGAGGRPVLPADVEEGIRWLRKAVDAGSKTAHMKLVKVLCGQAGRGAEGLKELQKAAAKGNPQAVAVLAA